MLLSVPKMTERLNILTSNFLSLNLCFSISVVAMGNFTEETAGDTTSMVTSDGNGKRIYDIHVTENLPNNDNPDIHDPDSEREETKNMDDRYIGIIIGTLAALLALFIAIFLYLFLRHRKHKYSNANSEKSGPEHHVTLNLNDLRAMTNGKLSNGNMYNSIATSESGVMAENDANDRRALHHCDGDGDDINDNRANCVVVGPSIYKPQPIHPSVVHQDQAGLEQEGWVQTRELPDLPALKTPDSAGMWLGTSFFRRPTKEAAKSSALK